MSNRAWVTLATNDSYGLGALVLAHSLRRAASSYPTVVLITPSVTDAMRERLRAVFADVVTVDILDSRDAAHLALLQRPELGITFTKIHCWSLTQYEKCVFLDADTLVIQNCDELFEREELSAAPDVGWPDCFNSGVFVYKPSNETFEKLIKFAQERGSFDGGDQGLLNSYFSDWAHADIDKHLPFLYNVTSAAFYSYLPALKHYGQDLKIIHFIGIAKPWLQQFNWESRVVDAPDHLRELLQLWWDLFVGQVHPQLDVTMSGVAGNLARVTPGASGSQREALDELTRRQGWEAGNIDYMGADSFDNIWAKISQTLSQPRVSPPKQPSPPKEPSPPIADPVVEVAQEAASIDASVPKTSAPVETQAESSVETKAKETPAVESPVAVQTAVETPVEVPVTVESASKAPEAVPAVDATDLVAPAEIPATVEAVTAVASKPQEAPEAVSSVEPSDIPATVEAASAPGEAPSDVPVSVETAAVPDVTKDEPQNTEAPALPPTPPVTPKSTPESTPVSEIAPQLEPVNVTQTEVSVPATESASESAPQVESVETPRVEVPVSVPEPTSESAPKVESDIQKEAVSAPASAPVLESAVESVEPRNEEASVPSSVPASDSAPKVETQKEEVSSAPTPASDSEPKVETQTEEVSSAPTPASDGEPKVESQKEEVSSTPTPASDSEPKVESQKKEGSSAPIPASDSEPKVETQKEDVSSAPSSASDSEPKVESQKEEVVTASAPASENVPQVQPVESPKEVAPVPVEAPKDPEAPATPAKPDATPERPSEAPSPAASTDSPPLANTPSKEEAPKLPAAKSEERRKVGKLQLSPPAVADPLPTPDSELEDAASLAQSIIASELRTPTVTAPAQPAPASPPLAPQEARLAVEEPEVPTPPISLAQIGVKAAPKAKPTTAAQIESSLAEKTEPASTTDQPAPKKKVVKKVKKESTAAAGSEAPVPPPRKKEKKPKEK